MSARRSSPTAVNVAELKRHFSDYLDRVSKGGERVVVRRRSRDVAILVPLGETGGQAGGSSSETPFKGQGLVAAVGGWADDDEIDRFVADIRAARRRTRDRKVSPLG